MERYQYRLENEVKVNIECNHATLAGHSFEHEIAMATAFGCFGSVDANRGDSQNGWDTDQFPNDEREVALSLYHVLKSGGLTQGGFNFDAKVRRQSVDALDLVYALWHSMWPVSTPISPSGQRAWPAKTMPDACRYMGLANTDLALCT